MSKNSISKNIPALKSLNGYFYGVSTVIATLIIYMIGAILIYLIAKSTSLGFGDTLFVWTVVWAVMHYVFALKDMANDWLRLKDFSQWQSNMLNAHQNHKFVFDNDYSTNIQVEHLAIIQDLLDYGTRVGYLKDEV